MLDPHRLSAILEISSDANVARQRRQHVRPLRGVRGTPYTEVARALAQAWRATPPQLPADADALHELFCTAFEDGLVAIGLLAALAPDAPHEALDLCERWLGMLDDLETADTLGWLVWGPALLAAREPLAEGLAGGLKSTNPYRRRAAVMAAMAALPEPIQGPSASALRERLGQKAVAFVDAPLSDGVVEVVDLALRDDDPHVRKGLARLLRVWGEHDPEAVEEWLLAQKHGVWRLFREEAERGISKGRRKGPH